MQRSTLAILSSLFLIVLTTGLLVQVSLAQTSDGRINEADHLGGMAVYCVDENMDAASYYTDGGIRVLDENGDEVLFVSNETIVEVDVPETNTVLGEADATFGPLTLYRLTSGEFQLDGNDEHFKQFEFIWEECTPIGAASSDAEEEVPTTEPTIEPTTAPTVEPTGAPA